MKDYVDLHFLLAMRPLDDYLQAATRKFGQGEAFVRGVLRALVYFDDAEAEPMPAMLRPVSWDDVKAALRRVARAEGQRYFGP